jgi:Tol biopolymer transport system component
MSTSTSRPARHAVAFLVAVLAVSVLSSPLAAQYFGRNQVQYRTFDFQILRTEHFDVYYYPEAEEAARDAARMSERWYARLSQVLDHRFTERQPLILFANHPEFQQNNIVGDLGEGTQGVTEAFKQRIVMPFMHSQQETDHLIGHELVHAFQYDISGLGRAGGGIEAAARRFQAPLWFIEGMAEYLAIGPVAPHTAMWLRDAALVGQIPSIEQMTRDPRVFPYRWGHAFWSYVGGRWGDAVIGQILKQVGQGVPYPEAFQRILNVPLDEIGEEWQVAIRRAYLPLLADRREARELARPLVTRGNRGGRINLAPSISPDGTRFAFLSELSNLDIEMYVASAETGEVTRRLVRGANFDPHFGSLRFIASAGTWAPDNRRFAFSALRAGSDVLVVIDADNARILREIRVPGVGELSTPTWSPDGRSVVFSGMAAGFTNLYSVDLETGASRQLTQGREADLHPAFSPDGTRIAFVTERGDRTDLSMLHFEGYRIGVLELASGQITLLPATEGGSSNINPQWTRDGTGVLFISNRTGIANIFRTDLATNELFRVTDLFTGVSGITALSPAFTMARNADRLLFTAYERTGYNIYAMTEASQIAGVAVPMTGLAAADTMVSVAAVLPPTPRPQEAAFNRVANLVANPTFGLPSEEAAATFAQVQYRPRLSLDYLGQPQVGVAVGGGPLGRSGLYGGIAGIFSDMLGRHTVFGAVQAQGQLDEIGFASVYLYRRNRWNMGAGAQRIPYVIPYVQYRSLGNNAVQEEIVRRRLFDWRLQGVAQYPFSQVQRVEFSGGVRRIAVDEQRFVRQLQNVGGGWVGTQFQQQNDPGFAYNMVESSAALVYDNSLFGWTSPFAGQRYRFEVTPVMGDLQFLQALADYRRYFFANPFTLAVRGMHFGRYGRDSDLLGVNYVGYPWFIRGYGIGDVERECRERPNDCVVNDLIGSRIGAANAELRFPLIRQLAFGFAPIGLPPIEGFLFGDAGLSWESRATPTLDRGLQFDPITCSRPLTGGGNFGIGQPQQGVVDGCDRRGLYTAIGAGARLNLFGYFVIEAAYVNPLDRPRGWHWQFSLQPGF